MTFFTLKKGFTFGGWLPAIVPDQELDNHEFINHSLAKSEEEFLFNAFLESMKNTSIANPNPSVGCVIVKNNKVISSGCTEIWGGRHAERVAVDLFQNTDLLLGTQVYVTLEPCTHFGRQPPCIDLFKDKGIQKVVVGCLDPNPVMKQRGLEILKSWGLGTYNPVLANEIKAWNYPFFVQLQQKRIFIALKWAQSLDGCLADDNNGWQWISNIKSRHYAHWLRQKYDAILVGIGTVLNDFPSLNVRHPDIQQARNPLKVIYDPEGKIFHVQQHEQNKLIEKTLSSSNSTIILINDSALKFAKESPSVWIKKLFNDKKYCFITLNNNHKMSPGESIVNALSSQLVSDVLGRPVQSIMVEGGPRLLSAFIDNELFDVAHIFIAPFFLGGSKNRIFSTAKRSLNRCLLRQVSTASRFSLAVQERLGDDTLIEILKK